MQYIVLAAYHQVNRILLESDIGLWPLIRTSFQQPNLMPSGANVWGFELHVVMAKQWNAIWIVIGIRCFVGWTITNEEVTAYVCAIPIELLLLLQAVRNTGEVPRPSASDVWNIGRKTVRHHKFHRHMVQSFSPYSGSAIFYLFSLHTYNEVARLLVS